MAGMYAFFAEHTNISPKALGEYSVEQIEYIISGFNENNKENNPNRLEGKDALDYLLRGGKV